MKTLPGLGLAAAIAAFGCSNTTLLDGTGGAGGSGGGTVVPPACAVATDQQGPYPVTFRFTNTTANTLFLREDCSLQFDVRACADDYAEPLVISGLCTVSCTDLNPGCVQCGPCLSAGVEVPPGQSVERAWSGEVFTFGQTPDGCGCHFRKSAPAAKYRVTAQVYGSQMDADEQKNWWTASTDFDLPTAGGVVEIALTEPEP